MIIVISGMVLPAVMSIDGNEKMVISIITVINGTINRLMAMVSTKTM